MVFLYFDLKTAAKGDADAINVRVSALEKQLSSLKQSLEPRLLEAREQEGSLLSTRHKIQHLESELKVTNGCKLWLPFQNMCYVTPQLQFDELSDMF